MKSFGDGAINKFFFFFFFFFWGGGGHKLWKCTIKPKQMIVVVLQPWPWGDFFLFSVRIQIPSDTQALFGTVSPDAKARD